MDGRWGVWGGDGDVGANKVSCCRVNVGDVIGAVPGDWKCSCCGVLFV